MNTLSQDPNRGSMPLTLKDSTSGVRLLSRVFKKLERYIDRFLAKKDFSRLPHNPYDETLWNYYIYQLSFIEPPHDHLKSVLNAMATPAINTEAIQHPLLGTPPPAVFIPYELEVTDRLEAIAKAWDLFCFQIQIRSDASHPGQIRKEDENLNQWVELAQNQFQFAKHTAAKIEIEKKLERRMHLLTQNLKEKERAICYEQIQQLLFQHDLHSIQVQYLNAKQLSKEFEAQYGKSKDPLHWHVIDYWKKKTEYPPQLEAFLLSNIPLPQAPQIDLSTCSEPMRRMVLDEVANLNKQEVCKSKRVGINFSIDQLGWMQFSVYQELIRQSIEVNRNQVWHALIRVRQLYIPSQKEQEAALKFFHERRNHLEEVSIVKSAGEWVRDQGMRALYGDLEHPSQQAPVAKQDKILNDATLTKTRELTAWPDAKAPFAIPFNQGHPAYPINPRTRCYRAS